MTREGGVTRRPVSREVAAFLEKMNRLTVPRRPSGGRLVFAIDATMSRQPTWDLATRLQADMFSAATQGLDVQLVSFRGLREFEVRGWTNDPHVLVAAMEGYRCHGGLTQISRVLRHAQEEHRRAAIQALVFIGDAVEESVDRLCDAAGRLGLMGARCFLFQEGTDSNVRATFRELARLSGGAYGQFDARAADRLREMLQAVAAYASGGADALLRLSHTSSAARLLMAQMNTDPTK